MKTMAKADRFVVGRQGGTASGDTRAGFHLWRPAVAAGLAAALLLAGAAGAAAQSGNAAALGAAFIWWAWRLMRNVSTASE